MILWAFFTSLHAWLTALNRPSLSDIAPAEAFHTAFRFADVLR